MNPTLMQLRINLFNRKKNYSEKELKIKRLFFELQTLANPYYETIEDIKSEEILQCAQDMQETKNELISLEQKIKSLKRELGEN